MGRKCSIPGCKTGYASSKSNGAEKPEKRTVYSFPSIHDPELRNLWLSALPNAFNFDKNVTVNMGICSLHWTGDVPYVRRGKYLIPSIPPNSFGLQKDELSTKNKNKKQRKKKLVEIQKKCDNEVESRVSTDKVKDFSLFCDEAKSYLVKEKWICELDNTKEGQKCIRFYSLEKLTGADDPINIFKITVFSDMSVELVSEISGKIPDSSLNWIFNNKNSTPVLVYWSQFSTLLSECSTGVWVDKKDEKHVYVNDLQELEDDNESVLSLNTELKDSREASVSNAKCVDIDDEKDCKRMENLRLTQELHSVIFQRNQLVKRMQSLQELANINLDMLSVIVNVHGNPENRAELDKVYKLIHDILNESLEISGGHTDYALLTKEQQLKLKENDDPHQKTASSIPICSNSTKDMSEIKTDDMDSKNNADESLFARNISYEEDQEDEDDQEMDENINFNTENPKIENDDFYSLKQSFSCEFCQKTFFKKISLQLHIRMKHTRGLPIVCSICGKQFGRSSDLEYHMLHHTDKTQFQCSECGKTFKWPRSFNRHCKYAHTEDRPFHCSICSKGFKRIDALRHHEMLHTIKNETPSKRSNFEFERGADNQFHCKICGKIFPKSRQLKYHMASHSDERPFQCTRCEKSFKQKSHLTKHEKNIHAMEKPFKCSLCPRRFMLLSYLQSHEISHHTDKRIFQCSVCNKTYKWKTSFHLHCKYAHTQERPFQCSICNKGFKHRDHMRYHEMSHMGINVTPKLRRNFEFEKGADNRYHCKICGKSFFRGFRLNEHMSSHSDERPFKCTKCDKSYKRKTQLLHHEKNVHERPFQCSICRRRFKLRSCLTSHEKAHENAQARRDQPKKWPSKCAICGRSFKWLKNLQKHLTIHSDETP